MFFNTVQGVVFLTKFFPKMIPWAFRLMVAFFVLMVAPFALKVASNSKFK